MGLLDFFKSQQTRTPAALPSGSFTVDPSGNIITSTISSTFPQENLKEISSLVLKSFQEAGNAGQILTELTVQFSALTLKARELRGGAIIFLSPKPNLRK